MFLPPSGKLGVTLAMTAIRLRRALLDGERRRADGHLGIQNLDFLRAPERAKYAV
jgi:hypothetical protein